jgi:hypothetical protein
MSEELEQRIQWYQEEYLITPANQKSTWLSQKPSFAIRAT